MPEGVPPLLQLDHKAAGHLVANEAHELVPRMYSGLLSHAPASAPLSTVIITATELHHNARRGAARRQARKMASGRSSRWSPLALGKREFSHFVAALKTWYSFGPVSAVPIRASWSSRYGNSESRS
jgi:hypothetical protein